jgi:hypothetical protein
MRLFIYLSLKLHHIEESKGLQSGELEGQISFDLWFFQVSLQPGWMILSVWARKAFSTPSKNLVLCRHIF